MSSAALDLPPAHFKNAFILSPDFKTPLIIPSDGVMGLVGYASNKPKTDVFLCFDLTITTTLLQKSRDSMKEEAIRGKYRIFDCILLISDNLLGRTTSPIFFHLVPC